MKKSVLLSVLLLAACANDPQMGGAVGGAVGGATGAAIGYDLGGQTGAILGGAIGGATGAVFGHRQSETAPQPAARPRSAPVEEMQPARSEEEHGDHRRKKHGHYEED
jgi:hypothetical protein